MNTKFIKNAILSEKKQLILEKICKEAEVLWDKIQSEDNTEEFKNLDNAFSLIDKYKDWDYLGEYSKEERAVMFEKMKAEELDNDIKHIIQDMQNEDNYKEIFRSANETYDDNFFGDKEGNEYSIFLDKLLLLNLFTSI